MPLDATVLIATYNRASLLDETLASLAGMRVSPALGWDVIVIDNNSSDATREVVERHIPAFPVRLRYLFEPRQGRSSALNAGIAAAEGTVLAFTDDDVRVVDGWLDAACRALGGATAFGYAGGPVRPIWGSEPPDWFDRSRGDLWGTIAIQNHGDRPFVYRGRPEGPPRREHGRPARCVRADRRLPSGPRPDGGTAPPRPGSPRAAAAGPRGRPARPVPARHDRPPSRPREPADAPLLQALVVRKGRLPRGARSDAAGDGAGRRPADDEAPARCAALHVRLSRYGMSSRCRASARGDGRPRPFATR